MRTADYWVQKLNLLPHPEGGYFRETYRSSESIAAENLPIGFVGDRNHSTAIYFLLENGQRSVFHKIKSDEIWHFHDGDPLVIYIIEENGVLKELKLGITGDIDTFPQAVVPAGCWFAAEPIGKYTLVGCTVSPGFDFSDFEMADRSQLIGEYPNLEDIIQKFTI